jgi:hypothetical protein
MTNRDRLELWCDGQTIFSVASSHAPSVGEAVSVRKGEYSVVRRSFAVDFIDDPQRTTVCCVCEVVKAP